MHFGKKTTHTRRAPDGGASFLFASTSGASVQDGSTLGASVRRPVLSGPNLTFADRLAAAGRARPSTSDNPYYAGRFSSHTTAWRGHPAQPEGEGCKNQSKATVHVATRPLAIDGVPGVLDAAEFRATKDAACLASRFDSSLISPLDASIASTQGHFFEKRGVLRDWAGRSARCWRRGPSWHALALSLLLRKAGVSYVVRSGLRFVVACARSAFGRR